MGKSTLRTGFDAALEAAINTALKYDPGTRKRLGKLQGRVLAVSLTAPRLRLYLVIEQERLAVYSQWHGEITTELSGSALAFVRLLRDRSATPAGLGVAVVGSSALLAELQAIMRGLDIDWEEPLARLLGDSGAHGIGKSLRGARRWLHAALAGAPRAAAEAVSEEWQFTPPQAQFEAFVDDVTELALGAERLAARVALLQQKIAPQGAD